MSYTIFSILSLGLGNAIRKAVNLTARPFLTGICRGTEMDHETAKRLWKYDPATGDLTWRVNRCRAREGAVAGNLHEPTGYRVVETGGKKYKVHRIAFLLMEGYMPEHQVDHINGVRDDNRWCNLRHVSRSCNLQNQVTYKSNRTGIPGVGWHKGKPRARARLNNRLIDLGQHDNLLEAALARYTWEQDCPQWSCNGRSEIALAIKNLWPQFGHGLTNNR